MTEAKTADVQFGEAPPPRVPAPYDWESIARKLRRRTARVKDPEKWWGQIFTGDRTTYVVAIRAGNIKPLRPSSGFEVRTKNNTYGSPRTCDLWMRYNPDKDEENKA